MEEGKEGRSGGGGSRDWEENDENDAAERPAACLASHHDHDYYSDDKRKESC